MKCIKRLLPVVAVAMAGIAPAWSQDDSAVPEPVAEDVVVVSGRLPGPPLWRVSNGEHVMWIFAYVSPIPKDMQWESARVENVVSRIQAFLPEPDIDVSVSPLVMLNPISVFRGVRLAKKLTRNDEGQALADVLPPALYQRYDALKRRYGISNKELDEQRPLVAGGNLASEILDKEDLGSPQDILRRISRMANRQRDVERIDTDVKMKIAGGYSALAERAQNMEASITPEQELACFEWQIGRMETDLEAMKSRANAWAAGYIDEFKDAPLRRGEDDPCFNLVYTSSEAGTFNELRTMSQTAWLESAEAALAEYEASLAVLHIREMLDANGLLAQLKAKGYSVRAPD